MSAPHLSPPERIEAAASRLTACGEAQLDALYYLAGCLQALTRERRIEAEEIASAVERSAEHAERQRARIAARRQEIQP